MRGKKSIAEWIRIGMLAALCIFLALLGLYQCRNWLEESRVKWENEGVSLSEKGSSLAGRFVELLWNHSFLENESSRKMAGTQKEEGSILACFDGLNPWNTYEKRETDRESQAAGQDPAYKDFLDSRQFYIEHAYLAKYGNEESGQGTESAKEEGKTQNEQAVKTGQEDVGTKGGIQEERPAYSMAQLADYDFLMKTFYNVHTSTTALREQFQAEAMLDMDLTIAKDSSAPQILIYHSHSQEAFADSGEHQTIVEVGDYLTELLQQKGVGVIHDRSQYDLVNGKLDRNKAYTYALEGITGILQENPQIQVVLDIHRDGVGENTRLAAEINGKPTAQIMFFNGLSRTPEGPVEYLPNPYLNENLAFSFQMQLKAAEDYPGYTRKIYLKGLRYNLHLRPRSSLIEVGAQTNTFEEARNAMEPLAEILEAVLTGK